MASLCRNQEHYSENVDAAEREFFRHGWYEALGGKVAHALMKQVACWQQPAWKNWQPSEGAAGLARRIRNMDDDAILAVRELGTGSLTRIRAVFPYEPPADEGIDPWVEHAAMVALA